MVKNLIISMLISSMLTGCTQTESTGKACDTPAKEYAENISYLYNNEKEDNNTVVFFNTGLYYDHLTSSEKEVYEQILTKIQNGISTSFTLRTKLSKADFKETYNAVYRDQPQFFWLTNNCNYSADKDGNVKSATLKFNELADNLQENIDTFNSAANSILNEVSGMSNFDKEKTIHDYLANNVTYENCSLEQSAFSAIVNKKAVCGGITMAFQYLMQSAGIPTYYVLGTSTGSDSVSYHCWNIVKLDNNYYNVDVTWDRINSDAGLYTGYGYFNQTDSVFSLDHFRDETSVFLPTCNSQEYSYQSVYGVPAELGVAAQLQISSDKFIYSLNDFNQLMKQDLIQSGTGTHTFNYMVDGDECLNDIIASISNKYYENDFLISAASSLGMNRYKFGIDYRYYGMHNEAYYLTCTVTLS